MFFVFLIAFSIIDLAKNSPCKTGNWYNDAQSASKMMFRPELHENWSFLSGEVSLNPPTCWFDCVVTNWVHDPSLFKKCDKLPIFVDLCTSQCSSMDCSETKPYYNNEFTGAKENDCMCRCNKCPVDRNAGKNTINKESPA